MTSATSVRRTPRLNRAAVWVTVLIATELAIAGAVLVYRSIVTEDPTNAAPLWAGVFIVVVMGIPVAFWTVVWALKSQPLRPIWAWSAFALLMTSSGLAAVFSALALVSLLHPIN
ncbi:hypothetical protein ACNQVK_28930 [Mycobacterium sp. 134]|uniref:hypothetical protein n=1 Tax=Mycobacterium sp. 134 TaxID=3400425 RepID=UPI003AAF3112